MEKASEKIRVWDIASGECRIARSIVKPMLTPKDQVAFLKSKGVAFVRCDEAAAADALIRRNTFLHIASYRKLFQKHLEGPRKGCYVNLDFADLLDLDELDCELRRAFLLLAYDVERMAKTFLVGRISETDGEDGYGIVVDFMSSQQKRYRNSVESNLTIRMREDTYTGGLITRYREAMPAWVFLEVVSFGTLLAFYLFCAERWCDKKMLVDHYALKFVKDVRNCGSHGSCIVNGFSGDFVSSYDPPLSVYEWLNSKGMKNTKSRKAKLDNARIQQLTTSLYLYTTLKGEPSSETGQSLIRLRDNLATRIQSYGVQNEFVSYLAFLAEAIDRAI